MAKTQTNKQNLLEIADMVGVGSFREMGVEVWRRKLFAAAYSFETFPALKVSIPRRASISIRGARIRGATTKRHTAIYPYKSQGGYSLNCLTAWR